MLDYYGNLLNIEDYMLEWFDEQRTYLMMYENISEGTLILFVFKMLEELVCWLVDNGVSAFGGSIVIYE